MAERTVTDKTTETPRFANREDAMRAGMAAGERLARHHNRRDALMMGIAFIVVAGCASAIWMLS